MIRMADFISDSAIQKATDEGFIHMLLNILIPRFLNYGLVLETKSDDEGELQIEATTNTVIGTGDLQWRGTYKKGDLAVVADLMDVIRQFECLKEFKKLELTAESVLKFDSIEYVEPTLKKPGQVKICYDRETPIIRIALEMPQGVAVPTYDGCPGEKFWLIYQTTGEMLESYQILIDREQARELLASQTDHLGMYYDYQVLLFTDYFSFYNGDNKFLGKRDLTMEEAKKFINQAKTENFVESSDVK